MAEPANSLHSDQVARQSTVATESVERGDPGTHQGRGFGGIERFRHARQRFHRCEHVLLVATVITDPANLHVRAIREISAPAGETRAVLAAVPADSDALALFPFRDARAHLVDYARYFVSGDAWVRNSRKEAVLRDHVAVTDSTREDADPHL